MIEIRELVIRAHVEDKPVNNENHQRNVSDTSGNKGCCADTVDMILKMLNDKKER